MRLAHRAARPIALIAAIALLLCVPGVAAATEPTPTDASTGRPLESFIDGLMADHFERFALAGASVTVVQDGEVALSKGYGHADLAADLEVDATATMFPTASVSKLFTWTAVMQLVEAGTLDLDADVNRYLTSFRVPDTFAEPVRLWHLLSHTAGFEDKPVAAAFALSADDVPSLEAALVRFMPARDREPGLLTAYSNYGTALAAHIVAEVSGMTWEEYVERHILEPLGMAHTSVTQPVPVGQASHLTKVYDAGEDELIESSFEYSMLAPAGGITATSDDVGRLLLAHLAGGRVGDARILQEATVEEMHSQLFTHDPRLPGNAHGFWEHQADGQRILSHPGDLNTSHTLFAMAPEHDVGFFLAYNSVGGPEAREAFAQAFWDHLLPEEAASAPVVAAPEASLDRFVGDYASNRISSTTMTRLLALLSVMTVSQEDGTLVTEVGGFLTPERWIPVGQNEFAQVDGPARMIFGEADGQVTHVVFGGSPLGAYSPLTASLPAAPLDGQALHAGLLLAAVLLILSALILWPVIGFAQRRRGRVRTGLARWARWWAAATGALYLLFVGLLVLVLADFSAIEYGLPPLLVAALAIGVIAAVMTVGVVVQAVLSWRHGYWGVASRLHHSLPAIAYVALAWQLDHWNLLGFRV